MVAGDLKERAAFDSYTSTPDGYGGETRDWVEQGVYWAEFIYDRGSEAVDAGGLTGTAVFKVKVRSSAATRAITTEYRLRDTRRGVAYNITEVDAITDRAWIWLKAESGVAI